MADYVDDKTFIHCRERSGRLRFRVWEHGLSRASVGVPDEGRYLTGELTERELRAWVMQHAIDQAKNDCQQTIDGRISQAESGGTSFASAQYSKPLNSPWVIEKQKRRRRRAA